MSKLWFVFSGSLYFSISMVGKFLYIYFFCFVGDFVEYEFKVRFVFSRKEYFDWLVIFAWILKEG